MVLGRVDERDKDIPLKDLGLDPEKEYFAFEFWTKHFAGAVKTTFAPGLIDTAFNCQVFCFREKQNHPQVLATNRHISCGGYDLDNLEWENKTLSGESLVVGGDNYIIYIHEDKDFNFKDVTLKNALLIANEKEGDVRRVTLRSADSGKVYWNVNYK